MKAAVQAIAVARVRWVLAWEYNFSKFGPKLGGPSLKQPTFAWSSTDKYAELRNFKLEVNNIFQMYNINQADKNLSEGTG